MSDYKSTDYFLWKTTKMLDKAIMHNRKIKNAHDSWARDDEQKAKRLMKYNLPLLFSKRSKDTYG